MRQKVKSPGVGTMIVSIEIHGVIFFKQLRRVSVGVDLKRSGIWEKFDETSWCVSIINSLLQGFHLKTPRNFTGNMEPVLSTNFLVTNHETIKNST